jgi:hypothetical protein
MINLPYLPIYLTDLTYLTYLTYLPNLFKTLGTGHMCASIEEGGEGNRLDMCLWECKHMYTTV